MRFATAESVQNQWTFSAVAKYKLSQIQTAQTKKELTVDAMLNQALEGFLGLLRQLITNLLGNESEQWGSELKKFLGREPCWVGFNPTHTFRRRSEGGLCSSLGPNFKSWFLAGGKVKTTILGGELKPYRLLRRSLDLPIISAFGGEDRLESTLPEISSLMEKGSKGLEGGLAKSGWFLFFVRDKNDILRVVIIKWSDDGWIVDAGKVSDPNGWYDDGDWVFSRNVLVSSGLLELVAS